MAGKVPNRQARASMLGLEALEARCVPARVWFDHFGEVTGNIRPEELRGPQSTFSNKNEVAGGVQPLRNPNNYRDTLAKTGEVVTTVSLHKKFLAEHIPTINSDSDPLEKALAFFNGNRATTIETIRVDRPLRIADIDVKFNLLKGIQYESTLIFLVSPEGFTSVLFNPKTALSQASENIVSANIVLDEDIANNPIIGAIPASGFRYSPDSQISRITGLSQFDGNSYAKGSVWSIVTITNKSPQNSLISCSLGIVPADDNQKDLQGTDEPDNITNPSIETLVGDSSTFLSSNGFINSKDDVDLYQFVTSPILDISNEYFFSVNPSSLTNTSFDFNISFLDLEGNEITRNQNDNQIIKLKSNSKYYVKIDSKTILNDFNNVDRSGKSDEYVFVLKTLGIQKLSNETDRFLTGTNVSKEFHISPTIPFEFEYSATEERQIVFELSTLQDKLPNLIVKNVLFIPELRFSQDVFFSSASSTPYKDKSGRPVNAARAVLMVEKGNTYKIVCREIQGQGGDFKISVLPPNKSDLDTIGQTVTDFSPLEKIISGQFVDYVPSIKNPLELDTRTDSDWFKFSPIETNEDQNLSTYDIFIKFSKNYFPKANFSIFNTSGGLELIENQDSSDLSLIHFKASSLVNGNDYFLTISNMGSPPSGPYDLTVRKSLPDTPTPTPTPSISTQEPALSIALNDPSYLRVVLVNPAIGPAQEPVATLPDHAQAPPAGEAEPIPVAGVISETRPAFAEQEILQGAALDIIASGAIDQLALFAGKGPADMPPEFWRLVARAADGLAQAPAGFSLMGDRLLRLGVGPVSSVANLPEALLPTLGESTGRTPTTMELVADAVFLPAEPTGIFIAQARFRRHWLEAAIVIISSAGATALAWPPRRDRDNTNPLQADGYIWN